MLNIIVVQKIETHVSCAITIFENRAVYEKMWKGIVQLDGPQMTWRARAHTHTRTHAHTHTHDIRYGKTNITALNRYITDVSTRSIQMCRSQRPRGLRRG